MNPCRGELDGGVVLNSGYSKEDLRSTDSVHSTPAVVKLVSDQAAGDTMDEVMCSKSAEVTVLGTQPNHTIDKEGDRIILETAEQHSQSLGCDNMVTAHETVKTLATDQENGCKSDETIATESSNSACDTIKHGNDCNSTTQPEDITMETENVDDSGISQIQIMCVQSMAADSIGTDVEGSVEVLYQMGDGIELKEPCSVTDQATEECPMDTELSIQEKLAETTDCVNEISPSIDNKTNPPEDERQLETVFSETEQDKAEFDVMPSGNELDRTDNHKPSEADLDPMLSKAKQSTTYLNVGSQKCVMSSKVSSDETNDNNNSYVAEVTSIIMQSSSESESGASLHEDIVSTQVTSSTAEHKNKVPDRPDSSNQPSENISVQESETTSPNPNTNIAEASKSSSSITQSNERSTPEVEEEVDSSQSTQSASDATVDNQVHMNESDDLAKIESIAPPEIAVTVKKSAGTQKFSTYTLQKARSMLHSALGTMPVPNHPTGEQSNPTLSESSDAVPSDVQTDSTTQPPSAANLEEHGDILDILRTHQEDQSPTDNSIGTKKTSQTPTLEKGQHKGGNQIAKKSTTKKPSLNEKPTPKINIKQEPVDDESSYGSMYTPFTTGEATSAPSVVIENVQGAPLSSTACKDNLRLLSNHVNRFPVLRYENPVSVHNPGSLAKAKLTHALNKTMADHSKGMISTLSTSRFVPPAVTMPTTTVNQQLSQLIGTPSVTKGTDTSIKTTLPFSNTLVPVVAALGPATGPHRVTIQLSKSNHAPVSTSVACVSVDKTSTRPTPRPIQPKGAGNTSKVQNISTSALLQTNAIIKHPLPMPLATINIDTVGLPRITELIARKNPIPNYKAPPVPDDLKGLVKKVNYLCYECGDTFNVESSLKQHRGRYSMKITYKCDECSKEKTFFNKCQFLGHLRQHLNIDKTQAVPIHIKSDSISIEPLPKIYDPYLFQTNMETGQKNNNKALIEVLNKKRCRECGIQLTVTDMPLHYDSKPAICDFRHMCSICCMDLPSICALRAHRKIHSNTDTFICPECGEYFCNDLISGKSNATEIFVHHLRYQCFHINRITQMTCPKCNILMENTSHIRNHLLEKVDRYYKCSVCPMAFRTLTGICEHFLSHSTKTKKREDFKPIYKCHVCSSVLDDLPVLEHHITGHISELKGSATYAFVCMDCREVFPTKEELLDHTSVNHKENREKESQICHCEKCLKYFSNPLEYFRHDLLLHRSFTIAEHRACKFCGNIMIIDEFMNHSCNRKKTKENFVCNFCNKEISNKTGLSSHMKEHKKMGSPVCLKCYRTDFKGMEELKIHEDKCMELCRVRRKRCLECNATFQSKEKLLHHECMKHSKLYPCHLCGDTYQTPDDLKNHVKVKHEAKRNVYPCEICNNRGIKKVFSSLPLLEKHLSSRHRQGKNPVISQKFLKEEEDGNKDSDQDREEKNVSKRNLEETDVDLPFKKLRVEGEMRFTCAKCSLTCEDRSKFLDHIVEHKVNNFIQCLECGLSFAVLPSLRKHLFMVHKVKDFVTYCRDNNIEDIVDVDDDQEIKDIPPVPEMDIKKEQDSLSEDEVTTDPLECRVCHKVLDSETNLRTHMRTHGMAFIRNKRRNKMVPTPATQSVQMNGEDTDGNDSSLSLD